MFGQLDLFIISKGQLLIIQYWKRPIGNQSVIITKGVLIVRHIKSIMACHRLTIQPVKKVDDESHQKCIQSGLTIV